jgi:hypothetical protein
MPDCLQELAKELQIQAFTVPIHDGDAREQWRNNCAQLLSALPPDERASQAMSFAMGLVVRGVSSDVALHYLEGGE